MEKYIFYRIAPPPPLDITLLIINYPLGVPIRYLTAVDSLYKERISE